MTEKKRKTKQVTPGAARITRVNIKGNVYSYENTNNTVKEKKENADCTD
jgi:hypothetical protein